LFLLLSTAAYGQACGTVPTCPPFVPPLTGNELFFMYQNGVTTKITLSQMLSGIGAGVTSFNGRSGIVVPVTNDYSFSQISGTASAAQGGTGVNASAAANGQLLIGNGSGFSLSTLTAGSNISITNSSGGVTISSTGGGTPGGSSTDVQYNSSGSFGGDSGLTYSSGSSLTLTGNQSNVVVFNLFNSAGHNWAFFSTGPVNTYGANMFGVYDDTSNLGFVANGNNGNFTIGSGSVFGFSVNSYSGPNGDTGISRVSAGVIALGNGSASDKSGTLALKTVDVGVSGTSVGSIVFANATSGSITVSPVTGALGSVTATLPANTGTLAELNLAQTWSAAQTFNANELVLGGVTGSTQCLEANTSGVVIGSGAACGANAPIRVVTASGTVNVTSSDGTVIIRKTVGAATSVDLLASPPTGMIVTIKDGKGDAATNNITVVPAAGNIDGLTTFVMTTAYEAVMLQYDGTQWDVL
jgi:hypothetical protein